MGGQVRGGACAVRQGQVDPGSVRRETRGPPHYSQRVFARSLWHAVVGDPQGMAIVSRGQGLYGRLDSMCVQSLESWGLRASLSSSSGVQASVVWGTLDD